MTPDAPSRSAGAIGGRAVGLAVLAALCGSLALSGLAITRGGTSASG